jgi:ADP-heptose:LPS heptosyltransferase
MSCQKPKTLCILFKYLGDVALAVPAIRALKEHRPEEEYHILVAEDALPIVRHLPWVTKTWGLPRKRGSAQWSATLPLLAALRHEHFTCSVDFVGNDRGALVSRVIGAQKRVGLVAPLGFKGRRLCYTHPVEESSIPSVDVHESERHAHLLHTLGVPLPTTYPLEVCADPSLARAAEGLLPAGTIIGHLSTSQPKKEWPVQLWQQIYRRSIEAGWPFVFASGPSAREQALLDSLLALEPGAPVLPATPTLDLYLAVLARARAFISGDTGPLHFAAGLGVPTLGLFAATDAVRWAPLGIRHRHLRGVQCLCSGHAHVCTQTVPCMKSLSVETVWHELRSLLGV